MRLESLLSAPPEVRIVEPPSGEVAGGESANRGMPAKEVATRGLVTVPNVSEREDYDSPSMEVVVVFATEVCLKPTS